MRKLIYQHKGMNTYRTEDGILQVAHSRDGDDIFKINLKGLNNAARSMKLLEGYGITPKLKILHRNRMIQEDLGDCEGVYNWTDNDWQNFRRGLVRALNIMRQNNIRHGDLNMNNIMIKDKKPYIIDWQESHYLDEWPEDRYLNLTDSTFIMKDLIEWVNDPSKSDPYRVCRRWGHIYGDLGGVGKDITLKGKTLLDIGCFQGDFCAFAAAELMKVTGFDIGTFRQDEDSIDIARKLWNETDIIFLKSDVMDLNVFKDDVVLFMDAFPYVVNAHGKDNAISLLQKIISQAGVLYFEVQMDGDGSGIEWLKTDDDVKNMCSYADWHKLAVIPERGIPRTLWRVKNGHN